MVDLVEIQHLFWTNETCVLISYEMIDIQVEYYTQHIFPYDFDTKFFDIENLELILTQNLHIGIYALWVIFEHFSTEC